VLASREPPVTVSEPCKEMFVTMERPPVAPDQKAQLAKAFGEPSTLQHDGPPGVRAVAGRLHGKPVLGFVLLGAEHYPFARILAEPSL
jgi:hypothetical protein